MTFKVCYAYGLRPREMTMLDLEDFGPNPHVTEYVRFGAIQVRFAKGTAGSGPRRRTVLTVPEFDWVVAQLRTWASGGTRENFATADRLTIVPHHRSTSPRLTKPGHDEALKRVIHEDGLETRDRAAAILILVFGQQAEHIARLTWDDVTIIEEMATIQLGTIQIALPGPLAEPWRELAAKPGHDRTA